MVISYRKWKVRKTNNLTGVNCYQMLTWKGQTRKRSHEPTTQGISRLLQEELRTKELFQNIRIIFFIISELLKELHAMKKSNKIKIKLPFGFLN